MVVAVCAGGGLGRGAEDAGSAAQASQYGHWALHSDTALPASMKRLGTWRGRLRYSQRGRVSHIFAQMLRRTSISGEAGPSASRLTLISSSSVLVLHGYMRAVADRESCVCDWGKCGACQCEYRLRRGRIRICITMAEGHDGQWSRVFARGRFEPSCWYLLSTPSLKRCWHLFSKMRRKLSNALCACARPCKDKRMRAGTS